MAVKLPTLVQDIVLNPAGLKRGAAATVSAFDRVNKASTATAAGVKGVDAGLYSLSFRAQTVGRRFMRSFGLPILGAVGLAINSFGKFENSMVRIEGLVGVSTGQVQKFGEAVKEAASATGRGPQELADAMFFIASAGLRGSTAIDVLNASAKASAIGLGQTKAVADAATSAVNAYGAENLSGSDAVDVLTAAVREGKVEAERLAPAIGKAIPVASAMGIEFHEVAAAIAAMTRTGTDARTSAIQLRQIMQSLLDPSRQTEKALREMGIAQGELADQAREKGLLFVLKRLRDLASENEEAFADVFPNIRALAGALDITGENLAENEQIFAALASSTGDTDRAFRVIQDTVQFKFNTAMADLKNAIIEAGAAFAPLIDAVAGTLRAFAGLVDAVSGNKMGPLIVGIAAATVAFGGLLVIAGSAAQAMLFFAQAAGTAATASTAAAGAAGSAGIAKMTLGLTKLGVVGLAAGVAIGVTALAFSLMGRRSETTAEKVAKVRAELADVKAVADISIKSLTTYTNSIRGIEGAMNGLTASQAGFETAFGDSIREVFEQGGTSTDAGLTAAEALIRTFGGQENTPELRKAFREIFQFIKVEFGDAFDNDLIESVFGTVKSNEIYEAILGLDSDESSRQAFKLNVRSQALGFVDEVVAIQAEAQTKLEGALESNTNFEVVNVDGRNVVTLMEGAFEALGEDLGEVEKRVDEVVGKDIKDLSKAFNGIAKLFVESLESGDFRVAADLYDELINTIANSVEASGGDVQIAIDTVNHAFQTAASEADGIAQDMHNGLSKAVGPVEAFLDIQDRVRKAQDEMAKPGNEGLSLADALLDQNLDPTKIRNLEDILRFAGFVEQASKDVNRIISEQDNVSEGHVRIGSIEIPKDAEIINRATDALEDFMRVQQAIQDGGPRLRTVEEVFEALEVAVNQAGKRAKEFKDRFDALTSTLFDFKNEQLGTLDAFQSFADAVATSGGSLDVFTAKGRDAQKALLGVIESSVDFAAAGVASQQLTEGQAAQFIQEQIDFLVKTAEMNGATQEEVLAIIAQLGLGSEGDIVRALGLVAAPGTTQTESTAFNQQLTALVDNAIGFLDFNSMKVVGFNVIGGIQQGMLERAENLAFTVQQIVNQIEGLFVGEAKISSPSIRFAEEVGKPITAGIAKGMLDERGKIRFTIKELVNDTISTAQFQISSVFEAIRSNINLEKARQELAKVMRDFGSEGEITKRESLTRKQLERDLKEAERAMRLGTGHQEDLELSLLDAREALEEFDANVTSGAPITEAQVNLMQAGFDMANAVAVMKMEGDKAIELFQNLGETMGLPMDQITSALGVATSNIDTYRNMFDDDVLEAIERAADAFIIIEESTGGGSITGIVAPGAGTGSGTELDFMTLMSIFGQRPGEQALTIPASAPLGVLHDPAVEALLNPSLALGQMIGGVTGANFQTGATAETFDYIEGHLRSAAGNSQADLQEMTLQELKLLRELNSQTTERGRRQVAARQYLGLSAGQTVDNFLFG